MLKRNNENEMALRNTTSTNEDTIELNGVGEDELVFIVILIAFMLLIFIGNGLTIWAYLKERRLRMVPFNVFIVSLSVADLLVGAISIPGYITFNLIPNIYSFKLPTVFLSIASICSAIPVVISVCCILLMTIDRLRMVKDPIKYKLWTKNKENIKQVVITSVIGVVFVNIPYFFINNSTSSEQLIFHYSIVPFFNFYSPCAALVIANALFIIRLHRQLYKISAGKFVKSLQIERNITEEGQVQFEIDTKLDLTKDGISDSTSRVSVSIRRSNVKKLTARKLRKVASNLFVLVITYLLCWCPANVLATITGLSSLYVSQIVINAAVLLVYFNSVINPIIYAFVNPKFRQAMVEAATGRRNMGSTLTSTQM